MRWSEINLVFEDKMGFIFLSVYDILDSHLQPLKRSMAPSPDVNWDSAARDLDSTTENTAQSKAKRHPFSRHKNSFLFLSLMMSIIKSSCKGMSSIVKFSRIIYDGDVVFKLKSLECYGWLEWSCSLSSLARHDVTFGFFKHFTSFMIPSQLTETML